ncbi:MAG: hypothetical protein GY783_13820 [Gammaproteobacteria bacterium]|nr:hypothetical protein [Gammaproteobacteria bacterium]
MSRVVSSLLLIAMLGGCAASIPETALRLPESTLEVRSIQTRTLAAPSEIDILTATIAVLQDMEFNIDRIEKPLGVITASKVTDADSASEKTGLIFLDILCALGGGGGCDAMSTAQDDQHITLTMVVLPSLASDDEYTVRITIQRVIYDKMDRIKVLERIDDAETYQQIFDNLQKSLFIQVGAK